MGSWDPAWFALLAANSLFTATTAWPRVVVGHGLAGNLAVAMLGSALYLLNFRVPNPMMPGLVDSAQACFIMAMV